MAIEKIKISEFITLAARYPVIDVRSPGEFQHAHIPGAYSLPLFSRSGKAVVGPFTNKKAEKAPSVPDWIILGQKCAGW
jgi:tRNA 2-selenouridine synthase